MFDLKWWDNLMDCRQVACLKYDIFNQQTYNPPNFISQLFLAHRPNVKNDLKTRQKAIHPWSAIMQCRHQTGMFSEQLLFTNAYFQFSPSAQFKLGECGVFLFNGCNSHEVNYLRLCNATSGHGTLSSLRLSNLWGRVCLKWQEWLRKNGRLFQCR